MKKGVCLGGEGKWSVITHISLSTGYWKNKGARGQPLAGAGLVAAGSPGAAQEGEKFLLKS